MPQTSSAERDKIVANMRAQNRATDAALWRALKRTPGILAGGTVDLANLALGFLAGKGFGTGLVDKPIGGSESINEAFGMPNSNDTTQNIAEGVLSMLSPGGAAAAGAKAIILPAALIKPMKDIKSAVALTKKGKADEAWKAHGVYIDPLDGEPKALIDPRQFTIADTKISKAVAKDIPFTVTPAGIKVSDQFSGTVGEVVDAPDLFKNTFGLNTAKLVQESNPELLGSYIPSLNQIGLSLLKDKQQLKTVLGHELQHGVQYEYDFVGGGIPSDFYSTKNNKQIIDMLTLDLLDKQNLLYRASPNIPVTDRATYNLIDKTITDLLAPLENARAGSFINYQRLGGEAESRAVEQLLRNPNLAKTMSPLEIQTKELLKDYGTGATRIRGDEPDLFVDLWPETTAAVTKLYDPNIRNLLSQFTTYLQQRVKP